MPLSQNTDKPDTPLQRALADGRSVFAAVGLFSFFINALMLTVPLYMLQIYDRVLVSRSEHTLLMLTLVAVGLLLVLGVLELLRSRVLVRIGAQLDGRLTSPLLTAMLVERLGSGRGQGQPIRDLDALRKFLTGPGLLSFFDAPWSPFFLLVIFILHPLLGFIALVGALVLFGLAILSELLTRKPLKESSLVSISADAFAESSLRNAEVIQGMGMLPGLLSRWQRRHEAALSLQALASDRAGGITATAKSIRQALQIAILGAGAYLAIRQVVTPGVMIVASIIMARALAPIEMAINSWRGFIAARSAYGRLTVLFAQVDTPRETLELPKPRGALAVESVFSVPPGGRKPVIKGISFSLDAGEMLAVIGPSAAGKSTLARLLVGIWAPTAGHVRLDTADISRWECHKLGPYLGYLPQDIELFDGTVSENIARFNEPDAESVVAAAQRSGVHEMILRLPDGYDTRVGEAGCVLSGGQRQHIALARAFYGDPSFIVLDEPNSNMDGEGERTLRATLETLKDSTRTVVVITHRPSIIQAADKVLVLNEGQAQHFGATAEVLQRLSPAPPPLAPVAAAADTGSSAKG